MQVGSQAFVFILVKLEYFFVQSGLFLSVKEAIFVLSVGVMKEVAGVV